MGKQILHDYWVATVNLLKGLPKKRWFKFAILWFFAWIILLSFMLSEVMKGENYLEMFPSWIGFSSLIHLATAFVVATVIFISKSPRTLAGKLVSVILLALVLIEYEARLMAVVGVLGVVIPILPDPSTGGDMAIMSLIFLALLFTGAIAAGRLVEKLLQSRKLNVQNAAAGLMMVAGFIFLSQAMQAVPVIRTIQKEYNVQPTTLEGPEGPVASKPDIYYIVLDRYASNDVLSRQLSFDNSNFTNALKSDGFVVNEKAYSNYPFTSMSIASTLTADYTNQFSNQFRGNEEQSRTLYHKLSQQSDVIKKIKASGYTYHNIGSSYGTSAKAPQADVEYMFSSRIELFGEGKRLFGLEQSTLQQSPFYRFFRISGLDWWPARIYEQAGYEQTQLKALQGLVESEPGGRFIFSHILLPHPPYQFNADGSFSLDSAGGNTGKLVTEKYTDQVEFINSQMLELVEAIKEKSGDKAVIILNSDEGPYPTDLKQGLFGTPSDAAYYSQLHNAGVGTWPEDWVKMKYGILQAVHIPEASKEDLAHLSSVNVFRIVLNSYLGYDLPYLPQCYLGVSEGNVKQYSQVDITERLTGKKDDYCAQLVE